MEAAVRTPGHQQRRQGHCTRQRDQPKLGPPAGLRHRDHRCRGVVRGGGRDAEPGRRQRRPGDRAREVRDHQARRATAKTRVATGTVAAPTSRDQAAPGTRPPIAQPGDRQSTDYGQGQRRQHHRVGHRRQQRHHREIVRRQRQGSELSGAGDRQRLAEGLRHDADSTGDALGEEVDAEHPRNEYWKLRSATSAGRCPSIAAAASSRSGPGRCRVVARRRPGPASPSGRAQRGRGWRRRPACRSQAQRSRPARRGGRRAGWPPPAAALRRSPP